MVHERVATWLQCSVTLQTYLRQETENWPGIKGCQHYSSRMDGLLTAVACLEAILCITYSLGPNGIYNETPFVHGCLVNDEPTSMLL